MWATRVRVCASETYFEQIISFISYGVDAVGVVDTRFTLVAAICASEIIFKNNEIVIILPVINDGRCTHWGNSPRGTIGESYCQFWWCRYPIDSELEILTLICVCVVQEEEIQSIRREIKQIADGNALDDDRELNELIVENTKLKHRLIILNKVNRICAFDLIYCFMLNLCRF